MKISFLTFWTNFTSMFLHEFLNNSNQFWIFQMNVQKLAWNIRDFLLNSPDLQYTRKSAFLANYSYFSGKKCCTSQTMSTFDEYLNYLHYSRKSVFFREEIVFFLIVWIKLHIRYSTKSWEVLRRISENLWKSLKMFGQSFSEIFREIVSSRIGDVSHMHSQAKVWFD